MTQTATEVGAHEERCPACEHKAFVHRELGCDREGCECTAPYGRIVPNGPPPTWRAADLPESSVVASEETAWIRERVPTLMAYPWRGTNGGRFGNWRVDQALASGAQVLRVGNGKEG